MRVTVLGAGAFGTALSVALYNSCCSVALWSRNERVLEELRNTGMNSLYLPGCLVPKEIELIPDVESALRCASVLLLCVPTQELRNLCNDVRNTAALDASVPVLVCSKGIENKSLKFAGEVIEELLPDNPVFVLSGPALAKEMVHGLPCAMVLAGRDGSLAASLAEKLSNAVMSIAPSTDYVGVQIGSVLKNIIAIACGIVIGKGLGYNASAMVVVRGIAEIQAVSTAKSGRVDLSTIIGLACLGDLVLTCTSASSRNMSFGLAIGKGQDIASHNDSLVEGAESAQSIDRLSNTLGIHLPVCSAIAKLLRGELDTDQVINQLLFA
ncbi:NAD(P)H-dependent glycerol-3-phosphate dehydrogenase [Anaplasma phagocytophilum]|uniref:NAD(P)H-dependent glycerol-3-phosphate dehydrogenase n=1 Tax=Anaplasma phagocytophilum TaxID=948 RepID=UPI00200F5FF0|nr:NAD(P)H-dependent glycerol-3-phosphate dehydrogenase [Anaplasma phagocytophilum]UQD54119.1 NAD(P)-dependent glycerol-3-phosphate dehydrogenase [Anaplasma phagocytophilum]